MHQNMSHMSAKKIGKPHSLCVTKVSMRAVAVASSRLPGVKVSLRAPWMNPYFWLAKAVSTSSPSASAMCRASRSRIAAHSV